MAVKVEMLVQVLVNGRPIWRKARAMRSELTLPMTDKEYDKVVTSAIAELDTQVGRAKKKAED